MGGINTSWQRSKLSRVSRQISITNSSLSGLVYKTAIIHHVYDQASTWARTNHYSYADHISNSPVTWRKKKCYKRKWMDTRWAGTGTRSLCKPILVFWTLYIFYAAIMCYYAQLKNRTANIKLLISISSQWQLNVWFIPFRKYKSWNKWNTSPTWNELKDGDPNRRWKFDIHLCFFPTKSNFVSSLYPWCREKPQKAALSWLYLYSRRP